MGYIYNPLTNWVYWGYNPLTNYVQLPGTIKWGIWTKICTPKKNWFPHLSIILGNEIEIEIHWNSYIFVKQVFAIIFSYRSQPDRIFSIREISDPLCFLFRYTFRRWKVHQVDPLVVSDFDRSMGGGFVYIIFYDLHGCFLKWWGNPQSPPPSADHF